MSSRFAFPVRRKTVFVLALWLAGTIGAGAATIPAPVILTTGVDSYTVSYPPCSGCGGHGLEEFRPASNTWEYVGSGNLSVAGRTPGSYRYRTVYVAVYGPGNYYPAYSSAATVTLAGPGGPLADLPSQLEVEYRARRGDINLDGRSDLLLSPTGPSSASAFGAVLMRQAAGGAVTTTLATSAELAAAAGWPVADLQISVRDVNIDGDADLVLRDVAGVPGFGQVANQIVFASADTPPGGALAFRSADATLARFSRDINRHLVDPDYYPNNAPLRYVLVAYYAPACYGVPYSWWGDMDISASCYMYTNYYYIVYRDYSVYDWEAMHVASDDYGMIHGNTATEPAMDRIEKALERVLGVPVGGWDINDLLGEQEAVTDTAIRRGIELFVVLAGISEAAADEPEGQGSGAGDADRVLLKGRRIVGNGGPFHTALEYHGSTISAYDSDSRLLFDGLLVSEVDWVKDRPELTMLLGYVDGPVLPLAYWGTLLARDALYDDNLPYDLLPSLGQGGYNSNSFVSGLIQATLGQPTVPMSRYIGGERPVPPGAFN